VNQQSQARLETRPAVLQFHNGNAAGTIYAHKVGGRIVEAYRGHGYGYAPIAAAVRSAPATGAKQ
jgi:hypothetical protein